MKLNVQHIGFAATPTSNNDLMDRLEEFTGGEKSAAMLAYMLTYNNTARMVNEAMNDAHDEQAFDSLGREWKAHVDHAVTQIDYLVKAEATGSTLEQSDRDLEALQAIKAELSTIISRYV